MRASGFTAIELLLVIALTAVMAGLVSLPLSLLQSNAGLTSSIGSTVDALRRVQTQAMSGYYGADWGVHFSTAAGCSLPTKRIWTFESNAFDSASDTSTAIDLPNGAKITALGIGGGCDVKFARFAGSTTSTGTVTVTDANGFSKNVSINSYGRIAPP